MSDQHEHKELMRSFLERRNAALKAAYRQLPSLLREHHGIEQGVLAGGYGYRQIMELVQNGADAILEEHEQEAPPAADNRIQVLLRESRLYVANTGAPLSEQGLDALLSSHSSPKRGNQIGRFGLGFKSLLRLGGRIDLFTKASGDIRFDPDRCRDELRGEFNVIEAPALRLAWPLEEVERRGDGVLGQLAWAETIVRSETLASETIEHLLEEIRAFPAEFLLFIPVPTTLVLDDGENPSRELRVEPDGNDQLLYDGSESSRWRIAKRAVTITDIRAISDATHIHARDSVPLAWAIPLEGKREEIGRFWAFFPTHTPTRLPGILNAPWKLNNDRNAITGKEWNSALMAEAALLIAETLPSLSTAEDPARPLDAFPRQLEHMDEDAAPLVNDLWKALQNAVTIPDATGLLQQTCKLRRHPRDNAELAKRWQELARPDDLARFIHPSCLERQRGSRLNALADRFKAQDGTEVSAPNLDRCAPKAWFESAASTEIPKAVQVLQLAEAFANECKPNEWEAVRSLLAIIPSQSSEPMTAEQLVFAPAGVSVPGRAIVASAVCDNAEAKRILTDVMKVKSLDDSVWETVLRESLRLPHVRYTGWHEWEKLRLAPPTVREWFIKANRKKIRVRRRDGTWATADEVLLPGALVRTDDTSDNHKVLVDSGFHGEDGTALEILGVCECPVGNIEPDEYRGELQEWLDICRGKYKCTHQNSASWGYLNPINLMMPKGWCFLPRLSGAPNARLTERYLFRVAQGEFGESLHFGHSTMSSYPKIDVTHPFQWFILKYGTVQVGEEAVRLAAVVAKRNEPALAKLSNWGKLAPALEKLERADAAPPTDSSEIQDLWFALIKSLATPQAFADDSLESLWSGAARDGVVPDTVHGKNGDVPLSQVFVTGSPDLARRVRASEHIVITLDNAALELWINKGARNLSELIKPEWASAAGPVELLLSVVPELADVLRSDAREMASCQPVSELKLRFDTESKPVPCLMWGNALLLDTVQLSNCSRAQRLSLLVKELAGAGWLAFSTEEALQCLGDARVDQLRAEVKRGFNLVERLQIAVGELCEPLLEALGALKSMEFIQSCTLPQLAELTLAHLGPATLYSIRNTLEAEGLKPPARWNTSEARAFVTSIGFPEVFAASPEARRDAEEFISGPIELLSLHDFQEDVFEGIRALLASGTTRRRAVVSLPTGGGKTRVTVEAAVRLVLAPDSDRRSVVWIAQTDELCEQAVQAFRQVWINLGAQRTDLRIVRLWGGNPNPAIQESDKPVVVVASIQTLNSRMGTDGLAWLRKPGLVVVDECHHAITPSYSNLLRWLDAEAPRPGAPEKDEPPIVGLSATPFRTDDEESQRLAKRFDNRWFPSDQQELHMRLCSQGVLSMADCEVLQLGVGLLAEEVERLAGLTEPWGGLDFENILEAINQRLAGDAQRSKRLVERIQRGDERAILFFANSVQHAEEMSARLNLSGISAAAVNGGTPTVARRYFLDQFQRGDIRVLCNYNVLSTGFDAPKTDMVLIARQVFSPVRYMQMVGRGLRGEKNGGTACCRIVTVVDNLGRFQDRHPYHYCQRYFTR